MIGLRTLFWTGLACTSLLLIACQINDVTCDEECQESWLDGSQIHDICADESTSTCLVSRRIASPVDTDLAKPVIIAVHGFTASTYEWQEFKYFADTLTDSIHPLVSLVLLGGHGRDIGAFQSSTWEDWGRPILQEYDSLVAKGYRNISFAGASTGATLIMQYIASGAFKNRLAPNRFFLIDPIVVPTSKLLSLANLVGPMLGNSPNPGTQDENRNWYVNRPEEDLKELYAVINRVKNRLEDGFTLPTGTRAKLYKSKKDGSADPVGALLIYKGMRPASGGRIEVRMVDSRLHVFTRLQGRSSYSDADYTRQQEVFHEMAQMSSERP